jgi:hypothetical protein
MNESTSDDEAMEEWTITALMSLLKEYRKTAKYKKKASRQPNVERALSMTNENGNSVFESLYQSSNPFLFKDIFRCKQETFDKLFVTVQPFLKKKEKIALGVFLNWLGTASSCRDQETKFHVPYATIHRLRKDALHAVLLALKSSMEIPSSSSMSLLSKFPYFDQAICAIDGVHIPVVVAKSDQEAWRNRKGWISTNTLIAVTWDTRIVYIFPGIEGSAHDSTVLMHSKLLEKIPSHHYVIADAGYGLNKKVLTPFRNVRYHLKEWDLNGAGRPRNLKEIFNLRHAKARNVVERTIGILKRRFGILRRPLEYEMDVIIGVIFAAALLHNFFLDCDDRSQEPDGSEVDDVNEDVIEFDFKDADNWRGWLAKTMWVDYDFATTDAAPAPPAVPPAAPAPRTQPPPLHLPQNPQQ